MVEGRGDAPARVPIGDHVTRSRRQQRNLLLSIVFAIAPFAFATIRAVQSRHDLRMLWMALAALAGVSAVMLTGSARARTPRGLMALSAVALVTAMSLAAWTAYRLGATAAAGIWPVAFVLSASWVMSFVLSVLSRSPDS